MSKFPSEPELSALIENLNQKRPVPDHNNAKSLLVTYSRVFRSASSALEFARNIMLNDNEHLTGGCSQDSVGPLWWIGVRVNKLEKWRSGGGFHRRANRDPEKTKEEML